MDAQLKLLGAQLPHRRQAIHDGHLEVHEHAVVAVIRGADLLEPLEAVECGLGGDPGLFELSAGELNGQLSSLARNPA